MRAGRPGLGGPHVRVGLAALFLSAIVLVGGCTADKPAPVGTFAPGTSTAASPPPWTEPASYGYVLERRCAGGPSKGIYRVKVRGGQVASADRIDGKTAEGEEEIEVPSLGELLDMATTAEGDGAAVTTVSDLRDGHPTSVIIDVEGDGGRGNSSCFLVSDYAAQP